MSKTLIRELEEKIVGQFVRDALEAGYLLSVSGEEGYDIDDMLKGSDDEKKIMEEIFACDSCHIFVHKKDKPVIVNGTVGSIGWVYVVLGNEGWDVISDYTTRLEDNTGILQGALEISNQYS